MHGFAWIASILFVLIMLGVFSPKLGRWLERMILSLVLINQRFTCETEISEYPTKQKKSRSGITRVIKFVLGDLPISKVHVDRTK